MNSVSFSRLVLTLAILLGALSPAHAAAPVIDGGDWPRTIRAGESFSYAIKASGSPTRYSSSPLPAGLTLDSGSGVVYGLPWPPGRSIVSFEARNADGVGTLTAEVFIVATPTLGSAEGWNVRASAGHPAAFTLSAVDGAAFEAYGLPPGMVLRTQGPRERSCSIEGTPATVGTYSVSLRATNEAGSATATLTVTVVPPASVPPEITTAALPDIYLESARLRSPQTLALAATHAPNSFAASGLPPTVEFARAEGRLVYSAESVPPGRYSVTFTATNAAGSGTRTLTWSVRPRIVQALPDKRGGYLPGETMTLTAKFNSAVVVAGAPSMEAFSDSARLSAAYVSGSGTDTLVFQRRLTADDYTAGATAVIPTSIQLNGGAITHASGVEAVLSVPDPGSPGFPMMVGVVLPPPEMTNAPKVAGVVGQTFSFALTASHRADEFQLRSGSLPDGLSLNAQSGLITGTPRQSGTFTLTVSAANFGPALSGETLSRPVPTRQVSAPTAWTLEVQAAPASSTGTSAPVVNIPVPQTPGSANPLGTTTPTGPASPAAPAPTDSATVPPIATTPAPPLSPPRTTQEIEFLAPVSAPVLGQPHRLSASSSAGLPIMFVVVSGEARVDGDAVIVQTQGPVVVRAVQSGTDRVAPASAEVTLSRAVKAPQTIQLTAPAVKRTGDASFAVEARASSGLPVILTLVSGPAALQENVVTLTGSAGRIVLRAAQAGTAMIEPVEATHSIDVAAAPSSRLANVSARLHVSETDASRTFITGFVVAGGAPQRVLIRAAGPALASFGVQATLANPAVRLFDANGQLVAENDDWSSAEVDEMAQQVGAFSLPNGSRDAALARTLPPGAYTVHVIARAGAGVALAEIFDASEPNGATRPPLANLSSRGYVDAGEGQMGAGFVISGDQPKRVLVRGIGPALANFGVRDALVDPVLTLYRGGTAIAENDDWMTPSVLAGSVMPANSSETARAMTAAGAFPLASTAKDAALMVELPPGAYTALVRGADGTTGTALVEVYELP
jgi:PKD repeat protein